MVARCCGRDNRSGERRSKSKSNEPATDESYLNANGKLLPVSTYLGLLAS